jgi:hypothetical protein
LGKPCTTRPPKGAVTEGLISALRENKPEILALLGAGKPSNHSVVEDSGKLYPNLGHPPHSRQELVWLIDYLSDPKAFAAWFEKLMQRADPAEWSE